MAGLRIMTGNLLLLMTGYILVLATFLATFCDW
jgi:hypothetical protein